MADCCDPISYRRFFNSKEARRRLRNYRKRGLDKRATAILDYLKTRDIDGADVLEVGGGVGDFQVELLKAGAAKAMNIELSQGYEVSAEKLADEEGFADRMERRFGDFVDVEDEVEPAQIVLLNRVVCCYPFMERMMAAAVNKTDRFLGLVFPRERLMTKAFIKAGNTYCAVRRVDFRAFVHPVDGVLGVAANSGLSVRHQSQDFFWQSVVFERVA